MIGIKYTYKHSNLIGDYIMDSYYQLIDVLSKKAIELIMNNNITEETYSIIHCVIEMYSVANRVNIKKHIDNGIISV